MLSEKNISLYNLADRVIKGEFGNGTTRKEKLSYLYPLVQNIVNEKLSCTSRISIDNELIQKIAQKSLEGVFGSFDTLDSNLGSIYPCVLNKITEIVQEKIKNKLIIEIAKEVMEGKYGNGDFRKIVLGDIYNIVQNKVNELLQLKKRHELNEKNIEILSHRIIKGEFNEEQIKNEFKNYYEKIQKKINLINDLDKLTIEELANNVIKGYYGNGDERKKKLGKLYPLVQNKVNELVGSNYRHDINEESIQILVDRVFRREFGNGNERKEKLGELYPFVQNRINEKLGFHTVYEEKPIPSYVKI